MVSLERSSCVFCSSNTIPCSTCSQASPSEEANLVDYMDCGHEVLQEYRAILANKGTTSKITSLLARSTCRTAIQLRGRLPGDLSTLGIQRIPSRHGPDLETQVIELNHLRQDWIDPRLAEGLDWLANSDAVIINVDYPLGLGAYELLTRVTERVSRLLGVYVMGKAATLNGRIGDVMVSGVVHDNIAEYLPL
jgi:hypothetical protein